jgi:hypothetical protein
LGDYIKKIRYNHPIKCEKMSFRYEQYIDNDVGYSNFERIQRRRPSNDKFNSKSRDKLKYKNKQRQKMRQREEY